MERKTEKINLFGLELILAERTAGDVVAWNSYVNRKSDVDGIFLMALIVKQSLMINKERCPFWNIVRRWRLRRRLTEKYIINHLSNSQIAEINKRIAILEGAEVLPEAGKKKAAPATKAQSATLSQMH